VGWRLENEFGRKRVQDRVSGDVWYVAANRLPRRQSIDAVYVTRFQSERWANAAGDYPKVDAEFLRKKEFRTTAVMHPLPRVNELDLALDSDKRAAYFEQAAYGVPIRMAIVSALLSSRRNQKLKRFPGGFDNSTTPTFTVEPSSGIACVNGNCIVHDPVERPYAAAKFHLLASEPPRLRCFYCETDLTTFWIADSITRTLFPNGEPPFVWSRAPKPSLCFYASPEKAAQSGISRRGADRTVVSAMRRANSRG
jgi:aspartate carbamoyltransferase regulatory subunit